MLLVGCIKKCKAFGEIRTRFFSLNEETKDIKDVTIDLCKAIDKYNEVSYKIRENGDYSMVIPYKYKDGLAVYSHGCGLSHYLQEDTFKDIVNRNNNELSFPLEKSKLYMLTPDDVKHILKCKSVFDNNIEKSLIERYCD